MCRTDLLRKQAAEPEGQSDEPLGSESQPQQGEPVGGHGFDIGVEAQGGGLADGLDGKFADVEEVFIIEAVKPTVLDRHVAVDVAAVFLAVSHVIDGLHRGDACQLAREVAVELGARAGIHGTRRHAQQALLELAAAGDLRTGEGRLDRLAIMRKGYAEVVPGLVGLRAGLVVERGGLTVGDHLHHAGAQHGVLAHFVVGHVGVCFAHRGGFALEGVQFQLEPVQPVPIVERELCVAASVIGKAGLLGWAGSGEQVAQVAVFLHVLRR